ncbi:MAG TPA: UDP-N-acetyl-D-mannosamine dehydrogenase, partial [Rhodospirillaceae bacterium]|nr:UDP-N-acetyl-D-mannosamine dehydrogenase [Rhodospirillaceae bacterium]
QGVVATGNLTATSQPESADAFIIAVPTPFTGAHTPDISYVMAAADGIAPLLEPGNLVIIESTCPVGTTELISARLAELRTDLSFPHDKGETADVKIAHVPERVLPGRILVELTVNDRIVGGV